MCGRFAFFSSKEELTKDFDLESSPQDVYSNYNFSPQENTYIIFMQDSKKQIETAAWGFIPHWSKQTESSQYVINARSETLTSKPFFKDAFKYHRCLIPANGFYEWKKKGSSKIPYFIHLKNNALFAFAGLYASSLLDDSKCFCILTCSANEKLKDIHSRMPIILQKSEYLTWINQKDTKDFQNLLNPLGSENIHFHPVSTKVNSWKNKESSCIREEIPEESYDLFPSF
jgi:putative SOS response-associated peptidase YedK